MHPFFLPRAHSQPLLATGLSQNISAYSVHLHPASFSPSWLYPSTSPSSHDRPRSVPLHLAAMFLPHLGSGQVTGYFPYNVLSPVSPEPPAISSDLITGELEPLSCIYSWPAVISSQSPELLQSQDASVAHTHLVPTLCPLAHSCGQ